MVLSRIIPVQILQSYHIVSDSRGRRGKGGVEEGDIINSLTRKPVETLHQ